MKNYILGLCAASSALHQESVRSFMESYLYKHPIDLNTFAMIEKDPIDLLNEIIENIARMIYKLVYSVDGIYISEHTIPEHAISVEDVNIIFNGTEEQTDKILRELFDIMPKFIFKPITKSVYENIITGDPTKTFKANVIMLVMRTMRYAILNGGYVVVKKDKNKETEVKTIKFLPKFEQHVKKLYELKIVDSSEVFYR